MPAQTVNIHLPEDIYQHLQRVATATHQPLEDVIFQTIRSNLPPSAEEVAHDLRDAIADLPLLPDDALLAIAQESLPPRQWRRHQHLLRKHQAQPLTAAEQRELADLRTRTDRFVTRRSYALALLKWRGHPVPPGTP